MPLGLDRVLETICQENHEMDPFMGTTNDTTMTPQETHFLKFTKKPENPENALKTKGHPDPDPYHGYPPRSAPSCHTPLPGYHHPAADALTRCTTRLSAVSGLRHRSPGFIRIQSGILNTTLYKNHHFLSGQNGPVKNRHFSSKSLPNPHMKTEKCHF